MRSGQLSVSVHSEYSRRTRRADDEHCPLLVLIGLEARLLLCFLRKPTLERTKMKPTQTKKTHS